MSRLQCTYTEALKAIVAAKRHSCRKAICYIGVSPILVLIMSLQSVGIFLPSSSLVGRSAVSRCLWSGLDASVVRREYSKSTEDGKNLTHKQPFYRLSSGLQGLNRENLLRSGFLPAQKAHLQRLLRRSVHTLKEASEGGEDGKKSGTPRFRLVSHKVIIPKDKNSKEAEDVAFTTKWHVGVADGVGGWKNVGCNPALYPKEFLNNIETILQKGGPCNIENMMSPVDCMKKAFWETRAIGSTTCCLVFLDAFNLKITTANLGDSGFLVYRRSSPQKILGRSQPQCHSFNFPYQLGTLSHSRPENAGVQTFDVDMKDWILLATDGLWDNLYDSQIIGLLDNAANVTEAAEAIAWSAWKHSCDKNWYSPFSKKAEAEAFGQFQATGGKMDDITVVVAQISASE